MPHILYVGAQVLTIKKKYTLKEKMLIQRRVRARLDGAARGGGSLYVRTDGFRASETFLGSLVVLLLKKRLPEGSVFI